MVTETRNIDYRYFDIGDSTIGRTETRRGDFVSYGGYTKATSEKWWTECDGQRSRSSIAKIEKLIVKSSIHDADALATFFIDSRKYGGQVVTENRTTFVDFEASFDRDAMRIFPRLTDRTLKFVARKATSHHHPVTLEYWDIKVNLDTLVTEMECFWTGSVMDLKLLLPPDPAT